MKNCTVAIDNLGVKLHKHKLISENQLFNAIVTQKSKGGYLSQHLTELGYIKETDLITFICCHYGYPYLPLENYHIAKDTINAIDIDMIRTFYVLPIEKNDTLLSIVMVDPLNKGVLELIKQKTQCEIVIFVSTKTEIKKVFEKTYYMPLENSYCHRYSYSLLKDHTTYCKDTQDICQKSRRNYKRLEVDAIIESYSQPALEGKVINISLNGVLFLSDIFLREETQIPINIYLEENKNILAVIEVVRCNSSKKINNLTNNGKESYEIGAMFNFLSDKDLKILADFLLGEIKKTNRKDILENIKTQQCFSKQ